MSQPDLSAGLKAARRLMITGVMLVMGGCVFGGLTAVVLMALGQRGAAIVVAVTAGLAVFVGVIIQVLGFRRMRAAGQGEPG